MWKNQVDYYYKFKPNWDRFKLGLPTHIVWLPGGENTHNSFSSRTMSYGDGGGGLLLYLKSFVHIHNSLWNVCLLQGQYETFHYLELLQVLGWSLCLMQYPYMEVLFYVYVGPHSFEDYHLFVIVEWSIFERDIFQMDMKYSIMLASNATKIDCAQNVMR